MPEPAKQSSWTFFLDRSLGRSIVSAGLRSAGLQVVRMVDLWPDTEQGLEDATWLARVGIEGWIGLTSDESLLKDLGEQTVARLGARVFVVRSSLPGPVQVAQVIRHLDAILDLAITTPGPFIAAVRSDRIRLQWPK